MQRIQRVEQKMRIDLISQRFQFQLPLALLILLPLPRHSFQFTDQVVQCAGQKSHFIGTCVAYGLVNILVCQRVAAANDVLQGHDDTGVHQQRRSKADHEQHGRQQDQIGGDAADLVLDIAFRNRDHKVTIVRGIVVGNGQKGPAIKL